MPQTMVASLRCSAGSRSSWRNTLPEIQKAPDRAGGRGSSAWGCLKTSASRARLVGGGWARRGEAFSAHELRFSLSLPPLPPESLPLHPAQGDERTSWRTKEDAHDEHYVMRLGLESHSVSPTPQYCSPIRNAVAGRPEKPPVVGGPGWLGPYGRGAVEGPTPHAENGAGCQAER